MAETLTYDAGTDTVTDGEGTGEGTTRASAERRRAGGARGGEPAVG